MGDPTPRHDDPCVDEACSLCDEPATHKVAEEPPEGRLRRHPFTNYLCCGCFGRLMGPVAVDWCREAS